LVAIFFTLVENSLFLYLTTTRSRRFDPRVSTELEKNESGTGTEMGFPSGGSRHAGQSEGVIEFPTGEESGVTGVGGAAELQLDVAVEIDAQGVLLAVTHWVSRSFRQEVGGNAGFFEEKAQTPCRIDRAIWEIRA
jgi:hypothetical protein